MAHASNITTALPEVPASIRARYVAHRAVFIDENLRALVAEHPGLLDAMWRAIQLLESTPGFTSTTVDYDEEDELCPVTIWARSTLPIQEWEDTMVRLDALTDRILSRYSDLVLVAIL